MQYKHRYICVCIHKLVQKCKSFLKFLFYFYFLKNFKQANLHAWPKVLQTLVICGSEEPGEDAGRATVFAKNLKGNEMEVDKSWRVLPDLRKNAGLPRNAVCSGGTARALPGVFR